MNNDPFDKELTKLYQQRKSQTVAPDIHLAPLTRKKRHSIISLLSIFTIGGAASFGIMAIISHFAKAPDEYKQVFISQHQIDVVEEHIKNNEKEPIAIKPTLPPLPKSPTPASEIASIHPAKHSTQVKHINNIELNAVPIISLPTFKEPKLSITPIYKEMPKMSQQALYEQHSGAIRLRYQIDAQGNVSNIVIIKSEVNRELQRAARKALAKWKYKPSDNIKSHYEIIFDFNPKK